MKVVVTHDQGQFLVKWCPGFRLPAELAGSPDERVAAPEEVRILWKEIKRVSPWIQKTGAMQRFWFGEASAWELKTDDKGALEGATLVDPKRTLELELDDDAVSGLMWILFLSLHPLSPAYQGPEPADDLVWPLALAVARVEELRKILGIGKAKRRWNVDPPGVKAP